METHGDAEHVFKLLEGVLKLGWLLLVAAVLAGRGTDMRGMGTRTAAPALLVHGNAASPGHLWISTISFQAVELTGIALLPLIQNVQDAVI